jgi:hypothetical protein
MHNPFYRWNRDESALAEERRLLETEKAIHIKVGSKDS